MSTVQGIGMSRKALLTLIYCLVVIALLFVVELLVPIAYAYKVGLKICLMLLPLLWAQKSLTAWH